VRKGDKKAQVTLEEGAKMKCQTLQAINVGGTKREGVEEGDKKALVTRRQEKLSNSKIHQSGRYKKGRGRGRGDKKALDTLEEDAKGKWKTLQAVNEGYTSREAVKKTQLKKIEEAQEGDENIEPVVDGKVRE